VKVATWNVNNVRKRLPQLLAWLDATKPDVVALQELKTETAAFPRAELEAAGYSCLVAGQKTWNGVALLSRFEPIEIRRTLPGDPADKQARFIEAAINGVAVACLYLPNGNPWPGPKFEYKLAWFERLIEHAAGLIASGIPVILLGDFNVVPTDELDIYSPKSWKQNALLQPEAREAYQRLLAQGWMDALRTRFPNERIFTFWDFFRKHFERDAGLRIDHILLSPGLVLGDAGVDREMRGNDEPSDHAPVWVEVSLAKPIKSRAKKAPATTMRPAEKANVPLATYNAKRDFSITAEPSGVPAKRVKRLLKREAAEPEALKFVVQKHWASRLHYDFRLELDGVMLSWAVPKGPSFDPAMKSMAIHVEDHPLAYNTFEGTIPAKQYGAGTVIVWDRGTWEPVGDPRDGMGKGKVMFKLHGQKLAGLWELVRISKPGEVKQEQWMLFKKRGDAWARPQAEYDVITALPDSVVEKPLGLVEEREPERVTAARPTPIALDDESAFALAKDAPLPATFAPQLATLAASVPPGVAWVVENKFDGYRLLARIDGTKVQLFTRNGHDWTSKLKGVAAAVAGLGINSGWLDGEIVVMSANGVPDFNALQNSIDNAKTKDIVYFVFDLPFHDGKDLRQVPLVARRARLQGLIGDVEGEGVRFSQAFDVAPAQMLAAACQLGMEGVIVKRADAPYVSSRTETWLKLKCGQRQEFVVIGYTDRTGARGEVGGLLLGYHEDGKLRSGGSVGTGWNSKTGQELFQTLSKLAVDKPPVDAATIAPGRWSKRTAGSEHWVKPKLVVEVGFGEWTPDGNVRHPVFKGVRADKPAKSITRERATGPAATPASTATARKTSVKVTNPERVIDPTTGLKKVDLVRYYESIADWMLPHLKNRPASLVRAPDGVAGKQFFQKHDEAKLPGLTQLDADLWPGHDALLAVDTAQALVSAAQMNVIEFHTWNSVVKTIDRPDRVIFDLDPGEGTTWANIQEAAVLMRTLLTELGLEAWLKTSGGKGLHVVVPLAPKLDYETVKNFSQAAVRHMAKVIPSRFVAVAGGGNRVGKIFIDYLRNGYAQTTAAAFSARSRPGLGVSVPVSWEQLQSLKSGAQWTIATAREYVSFQQTDPWAEYRTCKQTLTAAMKALGLTSAVKGSK
jgi:bifunctional non-homologous end joining protein LigD